MNKQKKEELRKKYEKTTFDFLTSVFKGTKVKSAINKFVDLADRNRKVTFGITMIFLLSVFVYSITDKPIEDNSIPVEKHSSISQIETFKKPGLDVSFEDVLDVAEMKREIDKLKDKEKLTASDSLKIKELYVKLKTFKSKK